jgi:hypothetical protein
MPRRHAKRRLGLVLAVALPNHEFQRLVQASDIDSERRYHRRHGGIIGFQKSTQKVLGADSLMM